MERLHRRRVSLLIALAVLITAVLAFTIATSCSPAPSGKNSKKLQILQVGGQVTYWENLVARFELKYPWIDVEVERVPGPEFQIKWNAYIAARSGPDLITVQAGAVFLPYKEALQPLPELKSELKDYVGPHNFCEDFNCEKTIYGIPYNSQGYVLYRNKRLLREAGLSSAAPTTWSELAAACEAVKKIGQTCIALGAKDNGALQYFWGPLPNQTMTLEQQQGFWTGQTKWTDPAVVQWISVFEEMVKRGWFNADAPARGHVTDAEGFFTSGKAAFIMGFVADLQNYATMGPAIGVENLGASAFPAIEKDDPIPGARPGSLANVAGISPATAFALSRWSERKREALLWIRYVGNRANQQAYLEQVGVPARLGLDLSVVTKAQPALADIEKLIAKGNGSLAVFYMGFKTRDAMKTQAQLFFSGKSDARSAAKAIQQAQNAP